MTQSGAILGRPGQYKSPPFLMMPDVEIQNVTLHELKANKIPEPEDINNIPEDYGKELVVVSPRTAKAYTYYCDLDADADWDDTPMWNSSSTTSEKKACLASRNMTGDGTLAKPWKNLTYALEKINCIVNKLCCQYVRLVCTGTAHYTARIYSSTGGIAYFQGNNMFILDGANIDVSRISSYSYGFYYCYNSIFHNCKANVYGTAETAVNASTTRALSVGFYSNNNSIFYNCEAISTAYNSASASSYPNSYAYINICGFESNKNSIFHNCKANVYGTAETIAGTSGASFIYIGSYCFYSNDNSIFYNCEANVENVATNNDFNSANKANTYAYSFYGNYNSSFYNCMAKSRNIAIGYNGYEANTIHMLSYGFHMNNGSKYYNCEANVYGTAETTVNSSAYSPSGNASGFSYCKYDTFYRCKSNAKSSFSITGEYASASASILPIGFMYCRNSTFYNCEANSEYIISCNFSNLNSCNPFGFYSNDNSIFYNCEANVECNIKTYDNSINSDLEAYTYGFYINNNSIFYNCKANTESIANANQEALSISYGFYMNNSSKYYNCEANAKSYASNLPNESYSAEARAYGIYCKHWDDSVFYDCIYSLSTSAISNNRMEEYQCGIYLNTCISGEQN